MRAVRWLIVALVLFAIAAYLMHGEKEERASAIAARARRQQLPRSPRKEDYERNTRRSTLTQTKHSAEPGAEPEVVKRDPFLVAFPAIPPRSNAIVIEANAIRYSAIGERLLACFRRNGKDELEELREKTGFDPLEQLDRVGVTDEMVMISGSFGPEVGAKLSQVAKSRRYGDYGEIYDPEDGRGEPETLAIWKNEMIFVGKHRGEVEAAIDRLEGRAPPIEPAIREPEAYGEIYGHLSPETLMEILPPDSRDRIGEKLDRAAQQIDLHVDVNDDIGLVATVRGEAGDELTDLAKSLGAALAVGRVMAKAQGEDELAEIMDLAKVAHPFNRGAKGAFDTELVLPREILEKHLAKVCPVEGDVPLPTP